MVKENLKEDQYIYALKFMELKHCYRIQMYVYIILNASLQKHCIFCLNTIDKLVQFFSPTGFRRYHKNKTYTLVQFIVID